MTIASAELPLPEAAKPQPIRGWVLLAAPVLGVVVFIAALVVVVVAALLTGAIDFHGGAAAIAQRFAGNYFLLMGIAALLYLAILFSVWLLLPKTGAAALASYFPAVSWRMLLTGAGAGIGLVAIVLPLLILASDVFHFDTPPTARELTLVPHSLPQLAALLAMGAVAAPLVEELYFRGLFLRWLRKRLGLIVAAIVNVVIFATLHGRFIDHPGLVGFAATAGLCIPAIVLVILAVRTGSLWPGVIAHGTYNAILLILSYVAPNLG